MYYPCSENKDADQLRGYREADLRLCFRPCKLLVFSRTGSYSFDSTDNNACQNALADHVKVKARHHFVATLSLRFCHRVSCVTDTSPY